MVVEVDTNLAEYDVPPNEIDPIVADCKRFVVVTVADDDIGP